jgi:hypothetical protein
MYRDKRCVHPSDHILKLLFTSGQQNISSLMSTEPFLVFWNIINLDSKVSYWLIYVELVLMSYSISKFCMNWCTCQASVIMSLICGLGSLVLAGIVNWMYWNSLHVVLCFSFACFAGSGIFPCSKRARFCLQLVGVH